MEGRSILENSQIAYEITHKLKLKTRGNIAELALKTYISKTYSVLVNSYHVGHIQPGKGLRQ